MNGNKAKENTWSRMFGAMVIICVLIVGGCARFSTERGVENHWRTIDTSAFKSGLTTQADVMEALGPPSQIISISGGSVFYYLLEKGEGKGLILLVYNQVNYAADYDRAIFFFDNQGVLTEYSYSKEKSPSKEDIARD